MTHFWLRTALVGLAGGALAACATSQYPVAPGQTPRAPLTLPKANFPVTPSGTQGAGASTDTPPSAAPAGGTVQSGVLPPPSGATTVTPPGAVSSQPLAPLASATPPAPEMVTTTKTIPVAAGKVVDVQGKPQTYQVQSGDTLYAIARKLGTSVTKLAEDNDLSSPYRLNPAQTLKGPAPKAKAYTVTSGDTLYAIARRFSVRAQDIADANEISLASSINVGQRLILPAGYKDLGPSTRTITSTQPRYQPPAQVPVARPNATTLAASTPPIAAPALTAAATPVSTPPTVVPPPATMTPAQPAPKPYTPPAATTVAPKPYTPPVTTPAVAPKPYTPPVVTPPAAAAPKPYTPPATSSATSPMIATGAPPTDMEVATAGKGRFVWPLRGDVVSPFGPKGGGQRNDGLNIRGPAGAQVQAAAAGEVVYAGDQVPGFGNLVLVKHDGGWVTAYAHLSRIDVQMRQRVSQGQSVGQVGSTGGVAEPQLHFEVRYAPSPKDKARPVNPTLVLPS